MTPCYREKDTLKHEVQKVIRSTKCLQKPFKTDCQHITVGRGGPGGTPLPKSVLLLLLFLNK